MKEHNLNINEFKLDEIVSIELIGEKETVDISVEDTHMFFANDIYTHNSAVEKDIVSDADMAQAYAKVSPSNVILTISRKLDDKLGNTGRLHIAKNKYGEDKGTYPLKVDHSRGIFKVLSSETEEGKELTQKMKQNDTAIKNRLKDRFEQMQQNKGTENYE